MQGPSTTPPAPRSPAAWERIEVALDALLALPAAERAAAIPGLAAGDALLAEDLRSLAEHLGSDGGSLDQPASALLARPAAPEAGLAAGTRLGPWRLIELLGRGGMGEVYRAERADGQFELEVAIKLVRLDAAAQAERFRTERQIVARLDHPCIARLLDGEVSADGRPYMVMELVQGRQIIDWCTAHAATLEQRLRLFMQVCEAVAFAHRNLVVHRDLKPANVLVTEDGRPKLLDFGIARLLDAPAGDPTREFVLTPGYAAPEQLSGGPVTTAADVHALGLLLHEMLCGQPAYQVQQLSLAAAIQQVLTQTAPPPSRVARDAATPAVPPQLLAGDLDAIVAKALRKEPEQRYGSVDALRADVQHFLRHEPVAARRGNWTYVTSRALRRHRAWALAGGLALVAAMAGTAAVVWEASVARDEAARAVAVKNFLLQVFKASDPRVASDQPRGGISARALLDAGAGRIEGDFQAQPGLQIELLGVVGKLYRELGETERYQLLQARRLALAQAHPGQFVAAEIEALINLTDDDLAVPRREQAQAHLDQADRLLKQAGLDSSLLRARWWMQRGLAEPPGRFDLQAADYEHALALFDRLGPHEPDRVALLADMGTLLLYQGHFEAAAARLRDAVASRKDAGVGSDGALLVALGNLGTCDLILGRYDEATADLQQAIALADRTYGKKHPAYWSAVSAYARLLHANGQRVQAEQLFEGLRPLMPDPPVDGIGWDVLVTYAQRLNAQGEPARALAWLEADERAEQLHPAAPFTLRRVRQSLAEVYEQLGRMDDAHRLFQLAHDEYVAKEQPGQLTRMFVDERWARHLLLRGDTTEAGRLFAAVIAQDADRHSASVALAQAGLARVALAMGRSAEAVAAVTQAAQRWAEVRGIRDVRTGAYIGRVQAAALLANGDAPGAQAAAAKALADSQRYDAPAAASITEARALLAQAEAALHKH